MGFLLAIVLDLKKYDRSRVPLDTPDETLLESLVPEDQDVLTYIDELKKSTNEG
jgi:hypothetical protein